MKKLQQLMSQTICKSKHRLKFFNKKTQLQKLDNELKNIVTDHALIRYLQRVYELDVNALRSEIIGDNEAMICGFRKCKIRRQDYVLVCDNGKVVTVRKAK